MVHTSLLSLPVSSILPLHNLFVIGCLRIYVTAHHHNSSLIYINVHKTYITIVLQVPNEELSRINLRINDKRYHLSHNLLLPNRERTPKIRRRYVVM